MSGGWGIEHERGPAGDFHARPLPEPGRRAVWWFEVERPALVLGSGQPAEVVDTPAAERRGVDVVRRRSGGGAVLVVPGEVTWIDVVLPAGDELWDDDVGRSFDWLGQAWVAALDALGAGPAEAHRGRLVRSPWSDLVCFAGLGPGEVSVQGRKVVGISQRRTRHGARFQCALLHRWAPAETLALLAIGAGARIDAERALADLAGGARVAPGGDEIVTALVAALRTV